MAKHRFPCPQCNHEMLVSLKQSGQELNCLQCSHHFEAPKLQILREYPVESSVAVELVDKRVSRRIFAAGMLLLTLFGAPAVGLQYYSNRLIDKWDLNLLEKDIIQTADSLVPAEIIRGWYQMEEKSELGEWKEHPAIRNRTQGKIIQRFAYGVWAVAGVGLMMIFLSPLFKKRSA